MTLSERSVCITAPGYSRLRSVPPLQRRNPEQNFASRLESAKLPEGRSREVTDQEASPNGGRQASVLRLINDLRFGLGCASQPPIATISNRIRRIGCVFNFPTRPYLRCSRLSGCFLSAASPSQEECTRPGRHNSWQRQRHSQDQGPGASDMPSPHAIASVSKSGPVPTAPALSSTPPQTSATFATTSITSPSPKSIVPKPAPNNPYGAAANSRHYHYGGFSNGRSAQETAYYKGHHIASAIADAQPSQFATTHHLPRTSSLLPSSKVGSDARLGQAPPIFQDPFNAQPIDSLNDFELLPPRRPSRSSSAGGLSDSFRNLNRWSASTTSSRASPVPGHRKNTSNSSRRVSVDVAGSIYTSPRKLQKHRHPSHSGDTSRSPGVTRLRQESVSVVPPLQSLPHIATLPSLEQELQTIPPASPVSVTQRQAFTSETASDHISAAYWDGPAASLEDPTNLSAQFGEGGGKDRSGGPLPGGTMPYTPNGESRGHSRSRSTGAKGSTDTTSSRGKERDRSAKQPSQKAMLSRALQKANTAVQLDNAQNPEGAKEAYSEACDLLQQVLQRTSGEEDRRKLEAIVSSSGALKLDLTHLCSFLKPATNIHQPNTGARRTSSCWHPR